MKKQNKVGGGVYKVNAKGEHELVTRTLSRAEAEAQSPAVPAAPTPDINPQADKAANEPKKGAK